MTPTEQQVYAAAYGAAFTLYYNEWMPSIRAGGMLAIHAAGEYASKGAMACALAALDCYRADHPAEGSGEP